MCWLCTGPSLPQSPAGFSALNLGKYGNRFTGCQQRARHSTIEPFSAVAVLILCSLFFFLSLQASLRWQRISWRVRQVPATCLQSYQSLSSMGTRSGGWKDSSSDILWIPTSLLQSHLKAFSGTKTEGLCLPWGCVPWQAGATAPVASVCCAALWKKPGINRKVGAWDRANE